MIVGTPIINPANGHSYYLLSDQMWVDAEAEAQSLGGHLVTINDAAENSWLVNTFAIFGTSVVWTGYNDMAVEGTFVWASQETPSFINFGAGEPNSGGGSGFDEDFVLLLTQNKGSLLAGDWNDGRASSFGIAEVAAVPEPGTFAILLVGTVGFFVRRRKSAPCT